VVFTLAALHSQPVSMEVNAAINLVRQRRMAASSPSSRRHANAPRYRPRGLPSNATMPRRTTALRSVACCGRWACPQHLHHQQHPLCRSLPPLLPRRSRHSAPPLRQRAPRPCST
jgi:hypothetical protein